MKDRREKLWEQFEPDTWPETPRPHLTVYDEPAERTGLLDHNGFPIMKAKQRIGFLK